MAKKIAWYFLHPRHILDEAVSPLYDDNNTRELRANAAKHTVKLPFEALGFLAADIGVAVADSPALAVPSGIAAIMLGGAFLLDGLYAHLDAYSAHIAESNPGGEGYCPQPGLVPPLPQEAID